MKRHVAGLLLLVAAAPCLFAEGEIPQIKRSFEGLIRLLGNENGHDTEKEDSILRK